MSEAIRLLVNPRPITTPTTSSAFWRWIRVILPPFGAFPIRTRSETVFFRVKPGQGKNLLELWGNWKTENFQEGIKKIAVIPHQVVCFFNLETRKNLFTSLPPQKKTNHPIGARMPIGPLTLAHSSMVFSWEARFWAFRWGWNFEVQNPCRLPRHCRLTTARHTSLLEPVWPALVGPKLQVGRNGEKKHVDAQYTVDTPLSMFEKAGP